MPTRMPFLSKTASPDRYSLLKVNAKENRRQMTLYEKILWDALREEIPGIRFRRQHPIGDNIADFICLREKLVIEVDGGYHEEAAQKEDDQRRTLDLARMGYTVIRFRNEEVANNTDHVIEQIKKQLFNE